MVERASGQGRKLGALSSLSGAGGAGRDAAEGLGYITVAANKDQPWFLLQPQLANEINKQTHEARIKTPNLFSREL